MVRCSMSCKTNISVCWLPRRIRHTVGRTLCCYSFCTCSAGCLMLAVPPAAAVMLCFPGSEVGRILLEDLAHLLQCTVQGDDVAPTLPQDALAQLRDVLANGCWAHAGNLHPHVHVRHGGGTWRAQTLHGVRPCSKTWREMLLVQFAHDTTRELTCDSREHDIY